MGLIRFLFFQCKTVFNVNICHVILPRCFPLFDVDHLEIANCYNLTIVFYPLGNFWQALCIRLCHEDLILTRKSHNCAGIAFIQGDSAGDSKLIGQTLQHEIEFLISESKYHLTTLILKANIELLTINQCCQSEEVYKYTQYH